MSRIQLQVGAPTTGLWCDTCLLPSAIRWPVHGLFPDAVQRLGDVTACAGCSDLAELVHETVRRVADDIGGVVEDGPPSRR